MENFIEVLSKKLNVSKLQWIKGTGTSSIRVPENNAFDTNVYFEIDRQRECYSLYHSGYCLQLCYTKNKKVFRGVVEPQIELSIIEVNMPGFGLGTKVMESLLETCRELNTAIKTIPAPIHTKDELLYGGGTEAKIRDWATIVRLRKYYSRLGFKATKKSNAVMHYNPSEITKELVA